MVGFRSRTHSPGRSLAVIAATCVSFGGVVLVFGGFFILIKLATYAPAIVVVLPLAIAVAATVIANRRKLAESEEAASAKSEPGSR